MDFKNNPKTMFLIDGIGAIVSAIMLGIVLPKLQHLIGMPTEVLYYLATAAIGFSIYSLTCFAMDPIRWPFFLKVIAYINLTYCAVSIGLVFYYYPQLSKLGIAYFAVEKIIVFYIAMIELKTAKQ